jgi:hypothetical protein
VTLEVSRTALSPHQNGDLVVWRDIVATEHVAASGLNAQLAVDGLEVAPEGEASAHGFPRLGKLR